MENLKTEFAGLKLRNPIIIGSCGRTAKAQNNKILEDAGAGAIVLKSMFEENILMIQGDICTPQARLSVYLLDENGQVTARETYGEVVWDFKLWPTLY